jgi:hypothetical protein
MRIDLAPHVVKMYETWRPYPDHDKRIVTIIKGSDVVVEDPEKARELIAENRRHILLKTTSGTVSADEVAARRKEFDQVFPASVYWKILHEQQSVTRKPIDRPTSKKDSTDAYLHLQLSRCGKTFSERSGRLWPIGCPSQ